MASSTSHGRDYTYLQLIMAHFLEKSKCGVQFLQCDVKVEVVCMH